MTKKKPQYFSIDFIKNFIFDPNYLGITCAFLILLEIPLNLFIINRVRYTEIDWIAYMQEVEGFLNGTFDYSKLKGNTGPLVYPAGFVYVYSLFYFLTDHGKNIYLAQHIFLGIYLLQLFFVFRIYCLTKKIPPYAVIIGTLTSYRIHSIYVLRLFNDPIAVLFFYMALNLFLSNKWILGSCFYSLAVSVKMNILLYAPCLLIAYLTNLSIWQTFLNLFVCGAVQLFMGLPFLAENFWAYIKGSFDFGRIFEHKWTVNYRFLDVELFESFYFHATLLGLHLILLAIFFKPIMRYLSSYAKLNYVLTKMKSKKNKQLTEQLKRDASNFEKTSQLLVLPFLVINLIGVACARSLHYQFYSWYFHSLLYLAFCTEMKKQYAFLLLAVIELCWNTYPSTVYSSLTLHVCHATLVYRIYKTMTK